MKRMSFMRVAILLHFCFLFLPAFPGIVLGQNQVSVQDRGLTAVNTRTPFKGKQTGVSINRSFPEDITSENYPDIIESFVFPNAKLSSVIKTMSKKLNVNIIMDPALAEKVVTIESYTPITVAEAYQAFLVALSVHGLTVVRSGSFLKIISVDKAKNTNVPVYKTEKPIETEHFITSIISLKHINANDLKTHIQPLMKENKEGSVIFWSPSNKVVITDYALNVKRLIKIIRALDDPTADDPVFKVIEIRHADAEELTNMISQLIDSPRHPRQPYRRAFYQGQRGRGRGAAQSNVEQTREGKKVRIDSLIADKRTNSIIVKGNAQGIVRVQNLIEELDVYRDPELGGRIFVYKIKHGTAKDLAKILSETLDRKSTPQPGKGRAGSPLRGGAPGAPYAGRGVGFQGGRSMATAQSFEEIRIVAEPDTNSLLIVANKTNYEVILELLKKVDIARNQVFVKAVVMEMTADNVTNWRISNYKLFPGSKDGGFGGVARIGYGMNKLTDLISWGGATLSFPLSLLLGKDSGDMVNVSKMLKFQNQSQASNIPDKVTIPSLFSFINFLKTTVGGNVLSTPQIMALDHQEAAMEVSETVPSSKGYLESNNYGGVARQNIERIPVKTELKITPHINPDMNSVRLNVEQAIENVKSEANASEILRDSVSTTKRFIKTEIILYNGETAVLGGFSREEGQREEKKIPILGDIPLLGWLFKSSDLKKKKNYILVFITPQIVKSSAGHQNILSKKLKNRVSFIKRFLANRDPFERQIKELRLDQQRRREGIEALSNKSRNGKPEPKQKQSGGGSDQKAEETQSSPQWSDEDLLPLEDAMEREEVKPSPEGEMEEEIDLSPSPSPKEEEENRINLFPEKEEPDVRPLHEGGSGTFPQQTETNVENSGGEYEAGEYGEESEDYMEAGGEENIAEGDELANDTQNYLEEESVSEEAREMEAQEITFGESEEGEGQAKEDNPDEEEDEKEEDEKKSEDDKDE